MNINLYSIIYHKVNMNEKIEIICGKYPEGYIKKVIENDPNFVFSSDSNYVPRKLEDGDGNIVFVNSFQECEHYASTGWDENSIVDQEVSLQIFSSLIFIIISSIIFYK